MVKYIQNPKTGKFAGSIGVGKTKTPQPAKRLLTLADPSKEERNLTMVALIDPRALSQNITEQIDAAHTEPINRKVAEYLTSRDSEPLLIALALNPTLDLDLLTKLATSDKPGACLAAIDTGRLSTQQLIKLATTPNAATLKAIATHIDDPKTLTKLSHMNDINVRSAVAKNPNTPAKTLQKLSRDLNTFVRNSIIDNPKTPQKIIEKAFYDLYERNQYRVIVTKRVSQQFAEETAKKHPLGFMKKDISDWLEEQKEE